MSNEEEAHLSGDGVIVKTWFADPANPGKATVFTSLPSDEELDLWADAAFTNGGPLVKLELIWAPKEAAKLLGENAAEGLPTDEPGGSVSRP